MALLDKKKRKEEEEKILRCFLNGDIYLVFHIFQTIFSECLRKNICRKQRRARDRADAESKAVADAESQAVGDEEPMIFDS